MNALLVRMRLALAGVFLTASTAMAAAITNADIVKLLGAGMGEEVILQVIASGTPAFDTSPDALVDLKKKGASERIVSAVLMAGKGAETATSTSATRPAVAVPAGVPVVSYDFESIMKGNDVVLIDGDEQTTLKYSTANQRAKARALGFGGTVVYYVLKGPAARVRTRNPQPEFIVPVPAGGHPEDAVQLARWEPRTNGTREILVAGSGFMTFNQGVPKERVVELEFTPLEDQSPGSFVQALYRARPKTPMAAGEYALTLSDGVNCYELGIDPPVP